MIRVSLYAPTASERIVSSREEKISESLLFSRGSPRIVFKRLAEGSRSGAMVFTPRCYWPRRTDDSYQDIVAAGANGLGPSALPQPTTTLSCSVLTAKFFVACGSVDGSGRAAQLRVVVGPAHRQDLRPRRARFGLGSSVRGRVRPRAPPVPARLSGRHSRRQQSAVRHQAGGRERALVQGMSAPGGQPAFLGVPAAGAEANSLRKILCFDKEVNFRLVLSMPFVIKGGLHGVGIGVIWIPHYPAAAPTRVTACLVAPKKDSLLRKEVNTSRGGNM